MSDKITQKWEEVKLEQPFLLDHIADLAYEAKSRGYKTWSMDALFHVLRWNSALDTGGSHVKINNDFTAVAARDVMKAHPDLDGFFRLRVRKPRGNWGHIDELV